MVSLCRYFLFALAISLSNCEAKLHEVTEEQLQNFHKAHGHKQRQRAKAAANETLLTAVKKIGDTCYSGTDCDSGQFCGLVDNNYYSSNCKFCDSYDPTISYDVARDREYENRAIKVKHIHENIFDPENEYDSPCAWVSLYNECGWGRFRY